MLNLFELKKQMQNANFQTGDYIHSHFPILTDLISFSHSLLFIYASKPIP